MSHNRGNREHFGLSCVLEKDQLYTVQWQKVGPQTHDQFSDSQTSAWLTDSVDITLTSQDEQVGRLCNICCTSECKNLLMCRIWERNNLILMALC